MHLLHLLLVLHVSATAALLLLLSLVVLGQRVRGVVAARRSPVAAGSSAAEPEGAPAPGASVVDWTIDLRGVGQREAALRT